jgi:two-component system, NtrC family, response regulator GlrR
MPSRIAQESPRPAATAPVPAAVLVVDDDPDLGLLLSRWLAAAGHRVVAVTSAAAALEAVAVEKPGVVVTDLMMSGMDGLALASELHRKDPLLPVVMLSSTNSVPDAVRAMHQGLADFLAKPVSRETLVAAVEAGLAGSASRAETFGEQLVYRSPCMVELVTQAARVAAGAVTVLITGETGTGKEVLARAIHDAGPRAAQPFVAVNCGAIPEHLLESELFGHERGAFTGALTRHEGLFRAAHGGTLFLDEVGDMPLALQVKLLRVLQDLRVRPVGATRSEAVDVRILAATHNDLPRAIERGSFREDLYYRLNVVPLAVPALRDRPEDIPLLADRFLARLNARSGGTSPRRFSAQAEALLVACRWPGNVRQLANVTEQCHTLSPAARIPASLVERALEGGRNVILPLKEARDAFERSYLERVLRASFGNVTRAASLAGRNRTEFYKLLGYHGLDARDYRVADAQAEALGG